ncbi:RNA polymerase factor sigma-54 [Halalkalibacter urbisdiaboli]|uniref:RNA polymerase factor sigma-54 n=1 Tax=Halalkalibacter urbisdiaboli TaxID=1960589 RepID=UPI000B44CA7E|nr:RNA polymerase factor sigma-54 [Halalkalibacter urbisdiaboli]
MELGFYQKQMTNLVMTKELQQAIHLLQFSTIELTSFIHEQALENPLIELKEQPPTDLFQFDRKRTRPTNDVSPLDYAVIEHTSLNKILTEQLRLLSLPKEWEKGIRYFIHSLDDHGYLTRGFEEICEELGAPLEQGERLLHILQTFEPAGVGARNLQECLLLQLRRLPKREALVEEIVSGYLTELAEKKWKDISKDLHISLSDIQEVYDKIQLLNPRPGLRYHDEPAQFVKPDLSLVWKEGELVVIPDQQLPLIQINRDYEYLLNQSSDEVAQYVREKYQQVQWLMKSIHQRQHTILKVTEMIAQHQFDFFKSPKGTLKPLTLRQVAEEIDMHESTVSRATTNKYVYTPRGVFELKALFSSSVQGEDGQSTSSQAIKEKLKQIVHVENKQKPLSDQKLVNILAEEHGMSVSRRAIAKYRDELGIPSSSKRKRYE